jgi:GntR family transcriptional regulator
MKIEICPDAPLPLYAQIVNQLRLAILTGRLQTGERLPTVRQFAIDLKINANTVARAFRELDQTGYIVSRQGVGTFVGGMPKQKPGERQKRQLIGVGETALMEAVSLGYSQEDLIAVIRELGNGGLS